MENNLVKNYPFVRDKKYFTDAGFDIENDVIRIATLGVHMNYRNRMYIQLGGNTFTLCSSSVPVGPYLGELITFLAEFFEETAGGGFFMEQLENKYIRLILGEHKKVVGFGHILKDQFVLLDDVFGESSKLWKK